MEKEKKFVTPTAEIISFTSEDIIATSKTDFDTMDENLIP